jgi:hypothetical protein
VPSPQQVKALLKSKSAWKTYLRNKVCPIDQPLRHIREGLFLASTKHTHVYT